MPARTVDAGHQSFLLLRVTTTLVSWIDRATEGPRTSALTLYFSLKVDGCYFGTFCSLVRSGLACDSLLD